MEHSFIKYLNSLKKFVCSEKASEVFSATSNTLLVSLFKSTQFEHLYRKLYIRN